MRYIDMHADTITDLEDGETLKDNSKMVDLAGLRNAGCLVQCFSAFVPTGRFPEEERDKLSWNEYKRIAGRFAETAESYPDDLRRIYGYSDIEECIADGKTGILLTIEDGGVLGDDPEKIKEAYDDGVRLVTLTWNFSNALGNPNSTDPAEMAKGLNRFGFEALEIFEDLGIAIDVSHLSDGGFWDVYKNTKKPFTASHSDSRALIDHPRNLTDEMIRAIAEKGGIVGLNYWGKLLSEDGASRVSDMAAHAKHIWNVGGEDVLALGSDLDGISGELEISSPAGIEKLYDALVKAGFPETVIEKMWTGNALRFFKDIL